jgi:cytochrome P450
MYNMSRNEEMMSTSRIVPGGHPIFGHLNRFTNDRLQFFLESLDQHGNMAQTRVLHKRVFFAYKPETFRQLMVEQANKVRKGAILKRTIGDLIGEGLLLSEGETHKRQRKLMQPTFQHTHLDKFGAVMVAATERVINTWQNDQPVNIVPAMTKITLDVVNKCLFDVDISEKADAIGEAMDVGLQYSTRLAARLLMRLPTKAGARMRHSWKVLKGTVSEIIQERRASGKDHGDLLSMLLQASDENGSMSEYQLRHEVLTLFAAGHETTANGLIWTLYLLGKNPHVAEKLLHELDSVLGERLPTVADLPKLPYLEMVVKEGLRLYPPAWTTSRAIVEPMEIDGVAVKPGDLVVLCMYAVHHNADYFPDPEKFDPERFSPDRESQIPRYAYLPFGAGPRVCIGSGFALMEARLILATLMQRISFTLVPEQTITMLPGATLRPAEPVMIQVGARQIVRA